MGVTLVRLHRIETLAQLLAETLHRAAGDRVAFGEVVGIVQVLDVPAQIASQRLQRGLTGGLGIA